MSLGAADDGKRFPAMDVVEPCYSVEKGGGLEEGGLEIHPERRDADSFFMFFRCRFLVCFRESFFPVFFEFLSVLGGPRGVMFRYIFEYFMVFA